MWDTLAEACQNACALPLPLPLPLPKKGPHTEGTEDTEGREGAGHFIARLLQVDSVRYPENGPTRGTQEWKQIWQTVRSLQTLERLDTFVKMQQPMPIAFPEEDVENIRQGLIERLAGQLRK